MRTFSFDRAADDYVRHGMATSSADYGYSATSSAASVEETDICFSMLK